MTVINLNKARKARARADERAQAKANAEKFGQTKAAREQRQAEQDKAQRDLDGHKLE